MGEPCWGELRIALDTQAPWARALLDGTKTVETRAYALPAVHVGRPLALLETPGVAGGGTSAGGLLVGTVTFGASVRYTTEAAWVADTERHLVSPGSENFGWSAVEEKWAWPVLTVAAAQHHVVPPPMQRELRSLFRLDWPQSGRVYLRPGFYDNLRMARGTLLDTPGASLLVLADFDRTMSGYAAPPRDDTDATVTVSATNAPVEVGEECHDVLFHHASLGPGFTAAVAPLLLAADSVKEANSVQDMAMLLGVGDDWEDWQDYATWWWETAHNALVKHGLTRNGIAAAVREARTAMRAGVEDLVSGCREHAVPLVVVSAGITDVIDALMVRHVGEEHWPVPRPPLDVSPNASLPPLVVHANTGVYEGGQLVAFEPSPPIHWLNKILTTKPLASELGFGSKVIVLLGDSVKDVTMVEGLAEADVPLAVLRIGFLNTTQESNSVELKEHMAVFDAVICGDGPMTFLLDEVMAQLWVAAPATARARL